MRAILPACVLVLPLLGACVQTTLTPPYPSVPAPQAEVITKPPVSEQPLIWQPGHWDWTGSSYAWTAGTWVLRAGHGSAWQDGYWTNVNGSWSWVAPHWI